MTLYQLGESLKDNWSVKQIPAKQAKSFIHENHYSRGSHNGPSPCFGLFEGETLIGCLMIATPCSENVRASVFGVELKQHVRELHRLAIIDDTPKNAESWFISRCLKLMRSVRPDIWALLSFADTTVGHTGGIYRATNAMYCGMSSPARFFEDSEGRLRHPRQNGVNISVAEATSRGWTAVRRRAKHRYLFLLGDRREKRERRPLIRLEEVQPSQPDE